MILQNMCLFLFNHIIKNDTFVVPALFFFAPLFISDSWYDKVKPLAYVTGGSKGVRTLH